MAILSKVCKPGNFESHNSLKLTFTNIWGLQSNFDGYESFLDANSPEILALCETNLDDSIDSDSFCLRSCLALIWKNSNTMVCRGVSFHFFIRYPPLDPSWLLFLESSFPPPSVLLQPPFKVFQTVPPPSRTSSCPNPTHQPSFHIINGFKETSKVWFYHFKNQFLIFLDPFTDISVILIDGIFLASYLDTLEWLFS